MVKDAGNARFKPNTAAAFAGRTRLKAAFLNDRSGSGPATYTRVQNCMLDLTGCDGIAQQLFSGSTNADAVAGGNFRVVAGTGSDFGGFVVGNVNGTLASFGFDSSMNYIGARKTPLQTGPRSGRGYL